jgi:hypothetical protein
MVSTVPALLNQASRRRKRSMREVEPLMAFVAKNPLQKFRGWPSLRLRDYASERHDPVARFGVTEQSKVAKLKIGSENAGQI